MKGGDALQLGLAAAYLVAAVLVAVWLSRRRNRWGTARKVVAGLVGVVLGLMAVSLVALWLLAPVRVELAGDPPSTAPTSVPRRVSTAEP